MCKKLTGQASFRLVYGVEAVIPMEYIIPSLHIAVLTGVSEREASGVVDTNLPESEARRWRAVASLTAGPLLCHDYWQSVPILSARQQAATVA